MVFIIANQGQYVQSFDFRRKKTFIGLYSLIKMKSYIKLNVQDFDDLGVQAAMGRPSL